MPESKKKRLAKRGWTEGNFDDFLGLSDEDRVFVEMKFQLVRALRESREANHLTQAELAKLIGSGQSRVAKMEAGDASVSLDLIIKALIALGKTRKELGRLIAT